MGQGIILSCPLYMTEKILVELQEFAPKLIGAVLVLVIGIVVTKIILKLLKKGFQKSKLDPLSHKFITSILRIVLYIVVLMTALSIIGVNLTSLIALFSIAGLAISLAIQDSLGNLAGGVVLLMSKPFQVGDYVELDQIGGTVHNINVLQTKLITFDNKTILIPNGQVTSAKIINFSAQENRRLDLTFSIDYNADFEQAKKIIADIVENNQLALTDPQPIIRVGDLGEHAVHIVCKVWAKNSDYWELNYDLLEQVKAALDQAKISIPYPQLDVHIQQQ